MLPPTRRARAAPATLRARLVPLGWSTFRLRDIHVDAGNQAWIGANEPDRHIPVVDLATGNARKVDLNLGEGQYLDMLLPVGDWLAVCGGSYRHQVFIHRTSLRRVERPLESDNPLIYGGTVVEGDAFLFDCNRGIYRWDVRRKTGALYPYEGAGRPPVGGTYVPARDALYAVPWWQEGMPPTEMVRFDRATNRFAASFQPPWPDVRPLGGVVHGDRLYQTDMFGGTMLVFDLATERWIARYRLPGYEKTWKYAASFTAFGPWIVCCLSTFQGVKNASGGYGFEGGRHHFVNRVLLFDPARETASLLPVPSLSGSGYATIAYLRTIGGRLYGTCVDSRLLEDGKPEERGPAYLVEWT